MNGVVVLGDRRDVILELKRGKCGGDRHRYRAPAREGEAVTGGIRQAADGTKISVATASALEHC